MRQSNYFFKNKLHAQLVAIAIAAKAVAMAVAVAQVGTTKYPRRTTREWFPSKRIAVGISGRRIWSELLLLFSYLFPFFLSPGQGRGSVWKGGGGRGKSARFCDLCVRLIHLFAYRFGVFSPPEPTGFAESFPQILGHDFICPQTIA